MTVFNKTISMALSVSGGGPTEKWGGMEWGTDDWLGPQTISWQFIKNLSNAVLASDAWDWTYIKGVPNSISLAGVVSKTVKKVFHEGISLADANDKLLWKYILNSSSLSQSIERTVSKLISNAISASLDPDLNKKRGSWYVVFPGGTIDGCERSQPVYTEV